MVIELVFLSLQFISVSNKYLCLIENDLAILGKTNHFIRNKIS